jgi:tetratricopeptide (TPR) repeat protein
LRFNKAKINENAQKFIQKKQLNKAISEYRKIMAKEPANMRILKKIGDLQVRTRHRKEAVVTYMMVADGFNDKGFSSKALAILKLALPMSPENEKLLEKMADTYIAANFLPDALMHLEKLRLLQDKNGSTNGMLKTLTKMADIDSRNGFTRVHLAETFVAMGRIPEAVENYKKAMEHFDDLENHGEVIRIGERLFKYGDDDSDVLSRLVHCYLEKNQPTKILKRVLEFYKKNQDNIENLNNLALIYEKLTNDEKAIHAYKLLINVLLTAGREDDVQYIYEKIYKLDPEDVSALKALGYLPETPSMKNLSTIQLSDIEEIDDYDIELIEDDDLITEENDNNLSDIDQLLYDEAFEFFTYGFYKKSHESLEPIKDSKNLGVLELQKNIFLKLSKKTESLEKIKELVDIYLEKDFSKVCELSKEALLVDENITWAKKYLKSPSTGEFGIPKEFDKSTDILSDIEFDIDSDLDIDNEINKNESHEKSASMAFDIDVDEF